MPSLNATRTAAVWLGTRSFAKIRLLCSSTVFGLIPRCRATCFPASPRATRERTSLSRGLRREAGGLTAAASGTRADARVAMVASGETRTPSSSPSPSPMNTTRTPLRRSREAAASAPLRY